MTQVSTLLASFKTKIEEAVALVPGMPAEEKLKAVQFWNVVSEKLQEIVNNSAADISALAFELEKENAAKMLAGNLDKPPDNPLNTVHSTTGSEHLNNEASLNDQPIPSSLAPQQMVEGPPIKLTPDPLNNIHTAPIHDPNLQRNATHQTQDHLLKSSKPAPDLVPSSILHSSAVPIGITTTATLPPISSVPVTQTSAPMGLTMSLIPAPPNVQPSQTLSSSCLTESTEVATNSIPSIPVHTGLPLTPPALNSTSISTPTTPDIANVPPPSATVPKILPSKRGRSRTTGAVKRDKNEDVEWTPLEERQSNRGNRKIVSAGLRRQSARQTGSRRSYAAIAGENEPSEEEEEDEEDDDPEKAGEDKKPNIDAELEEEEEEEEEVKFEDKGEEYEKVEIKFRPNKKRRLDGIDPEPVEGGDYSCEFCKKKFANVSSLTAHRWVHTKPYACTDCSARFSTKGNLIVHKRRHTGEKPYGCTQCDARFSTKGNLKRHVKTHSGEKPWECTQCGGRFTEKKSLKVHMRRHTGEKPYQCKVCGKRFAQTGILQTHMAMHMDQKAHLCDHCGKSFRQKSQLRLHMMRHEGVRKYQCMACPARFLTKGDLERHNRIHTGERPFICELCGKTFTRQQSLNEHMNRHYGLKPYECKYCGKSFAEMSACYKHIKQHERAQQQQVAVDAAVDAAVGHQVTVNASGQITIPADGQKFTVLVHTDQALDVGSEISVVQQDQGTVIPADSHITVAVADQISDFAAINLLANASSFQQNY